jgi:hypothetical protein
VTASLSLLRRAHIALSSPRFTAAPLIAWRRPKIPGGPALKLAYRLLLIVGHTLGDLALPLMRRQCAKVGATMENLTPAQAERIVPSLERVLEGYLARPGDLKGIVHEIRLEIGAERFSAGEVAPARAGLGVEEVPSPSTRAAGAEPPHPSARDPRRVRR